MTSSAAAGLITQDTPPVVVPHDIEPVRGSARTAARDIGRLWDVGGLPGPAGLRIRYGRVLVSDSGRDTSPGGTADLAAHGVRLVLELLEPIAPLPGGRAVPDGVLDRYGSAIATVLSRLACPSRQPAVVCAPAADSWSGPLVVMLWELLGVPRRAVLERLAGVSMYREVVPHQPPLGGRSWTRRHVGSLVTGLTVELDAIGGVDRWWSTTGEPSWVPESLRLTLLVRRAAASRPVSGGDRS
jgi:hypothetical protein